jgi:hypothetical protein
MQYFCCTSRRRSAVSAHPTLNGIDFLEVSDDPSDPIDVRQHVLLVHFLKPLAPNAILASDVHIDGGDRIRDIHVIRVTAGDGSPPASPLGSPPGLDPRVLVVEVEAPGDFSTYTLRLVRDPQAGTPPPGFDVILSSVDFSFKVNCPSDFDCQPQRVCPDEPTPAPDIDYLAKDYASFRQLMLDRMAVITPEWRERNPADAGIALVELLAYVGDSLSYKQDAAATEAYLHTARQRASVRRHVRLIDYPMHDGRNARTWIQIAVTAAGDGRTLQKQLGDGRPTRFLTRVPEAGDAIVIPEKSPLFQQVLTKKPEVFESLHTVTLWAAHNEIRFYTWSSRSCCLPKGATRATLNGSFPNLSPGDVLVFIEKRGPETGIPGDANPAHRHAVRLTERTILNDEIAGNLAVTEIAWFDEDALPSPLCISSDVFDDVSVALGNIVLADHGLTTADLPADGSLAPRDASSSLEPEKVPDSNAALTEPPRDSGDRCNPLPPAAAPARYRPRLKLSPVTQAAPFVDADAKRGASLATALSFEDPAQFPKAAVTLFEVDPAQNVAPSLLPAWTAQPDLLGSGPTRRDFVVEVENDGAAYIRFGDGETARQPESGFRFLARYRVGNGTAGNVGAGAVAHLATADPVFARDLANPKVLRVWNPIAASGGVDAETIEHARQHAPSAFRRPERAVTAPDWEALVVRPDVTQRCGLDVQRGAATRRWTGSWFTIFLTIDRQNGRDVDAPFKQKLRACLERYRMAGQDLEIDTPRFVSIELAITVCVKPGYLFEHVEQALLDVLSNRTLPDGRRGVFHPDNFTFGQPVYLSAVYAAAARVAGVDSILITTFQRQGIDSDEALNSGRLEVGRLEIARLDNDPDFPERGALAVTRG